MKRLALLFLVNILVLIPSALYLPNSAYWIIIGIIITVLLAACALFWIMSWREGRILADTIQSSKENHL